MSEPRDQFEAWLHSRKRDVSDLEIPLWEAWQAGRESMREELQKMSLEEFLAWALPLAPGKESE